VEIGVEVEVETEDELVLVVLVFVLLETEFVNISGVIARAFEVVVLLLKF
tara:strand:- start:3 stop:152 length:150 start_codon:yes stop_codon:yes gene_type:complete